jgi:hypothetical protein
MEWVDLFIAQIADPFRIGLMVALLATQIRTEAVTGRVLPLALGVVFIAAMIPLTLPDAEVGFFPGFLAGVVTNAVVLGVLLAGWAVIGRLRK